MIPVNEPHIAKNTEAYVVDCIRTGWISSAGSYIGRFESAYASYLGTEHAIAVSNGTAALHLAVAALGIGPGDEVIIPDNTIISCALAVHYTGAVPVPVDVDPVWGNIDPTKIEAAITPKTRAIMAVHLYGHPCDMDPIMAIAAKHHLPVIEDAAEAHGAEYKGKKAGTIGAIGCFSFYGNKIVTTGEGGMVVTGDATLADRVRLLKDLAHSPKKRFMHEVVGFNYRMTNVQAAMGLAQLEEVEWAVETKRTMAARYTAGLKDVKMIRTPVEASWAKSVYWMYSVTVAPDSRLNRDGFRAALKAKGVDTRDFFYPIHRQPVFTSRGLYGDVACPVTDDLSERGFYLPSGLTLTPAQIDDVVAAVRAVAAG
jgi:perosamine synthetase